MIICFSAPPHTIGSQQDRPNDVYSDTISEEDIEAMCSVLQKQRDGLQHLTDILTYVHIVRDIIHDHVVS